MPLGPKQYLNENSLKSKSIFSCTLNNCGLSLFFPLPPSVPENAAPNAAPNVVSNVAQSEIKCKIIHVGIPKMDPQISSQTGLGGQGFPNPE